MKVLTYISDKKNHQGIGGKARNLAFLEEIKMNVPKWAVIPAEFSNQNLDSRSIDDLKCFFGSTYNTKYYSVRSSGLDEDGAEFSFAGQFETFLYIPFSDLTEKIKLCAQSTQSERVIAYRKENDLPESKGIAVIIQEMVNAEVSGVAFGINPTTGVPNSKVISSVYGLGEGLVSGELDADTFELTGEKIKSSLTNKTHQFIKSKEASGLEKVEVEEDKQLIPSLSEIQIKEISVVLNQLKKEIGSPQDIEFAYENGKLYLLQTRPITAIANQEKGEYTVWDNSNIIESYPGITTPLTYSFIIKMYEMVYRQFVGMMGVDKKTIRDNSNIFENTLGLVKGRVYYNLLNWYKMLAMVPGYSINAENMERMMGVKEKFELETDYTMSKSKAKFRTGIMIFKMLRLHINLPRERRKFQKFLDKTISYYKRLDFEKMEVNELINYYRKFETVLLLKWKAPLTNDFFAMIWFGQLEKQAIKYFPEQPNIHNDLLCGSQDIISVEPIHRTIEICKKIKENKQAVELFEKKNKIEVWKELKSGNHSEIKEQIDAYISQFGNRCVGELKLETISYSQQPELFIGVIQSYLKQGIDGSRVNSNLEEELKQNATDKVNKGLKNKFFKKWWFNFCLNKTRSLVSNRENLRFERTRGFGMVRTMFTELGKKWKEEGKLENARDVFYLELDEIKTQLNKPFDSSLKETIAERKLEFLGFKSQPIPMDRFYSFGNNFEDEFIYSEEKLEGEEENLKGIGCCPGVVKGTARIVEDPNEIDSLNGDILVTSSTDPGWVTLFPTAGAILVERGSLLSHSAIVSREMGIPCIVSITGLLRTLKTGDQIEMNGSTGVINIID